MQALSYRRRHIPFKDIKAQSEVVNRKILLLLYLILGRRVHHVLHKLYISVFTGMPLI